MKKSKLLMPLTGIAAIGAIAPVAVMTSCGNKYNLITNQKCGVLIDANTKALVSTLGQETFAGKAQDEYIPVVLAGKLTKTFEASHTLKWSSTGAGKRGSAGTVLYFPATDGEKWVSAQTAGATEFYAEHNQLIMFNKARYDALAETGVNETFKFTITYTEYDGTTVVGKQDVEYSININSKLHDLPTITGTVAGDMSLSASKRNVNLTGWTLTKGGVATTAGVDITVEFTNKTPLVLTNNDETYTLTIDGSQPARVIGATKNSISFIGTLDHDTTLSASGTDTFYGEEDILVGLTLKTTSEYYVVNQWTCTVAVAATSGIKVTANA